MNSKGLGGGVGGKGGRKRKEGTGHQAPTPSGIGPIEQALATLVSDLRFPKRIHGLKKGTRSHHCFQGWVLHGRGETTNDPKCEL